MLEVLGSVRVVVHLHSPALELLRCLPGGRREDGQTDKLTDKSSASPLGRAHLVTLTQLRMSNLCNNVQFLLKSLRALSLKEDRIGYEIKIPHPYPTWLSM